MCICLFVRLSVSMCMIKSRTTTTFIFPNRAQCPIYHFNLDFPFSRNVPSSIPTHFASSLTSFGRKPISILLGPHTGHFKDIQLPTAILQYYSTILSNSSFGLGVGVDFGTTRTLIQPLLFIIRNDRLFSWKMWMVYPFCIGYVTVLLRMIFDHPVTILFYGMNILGFWQPTGDCV